MAPEPSSRCNVACFGHIDCTNRIVELPQTLDKFGFKQHFEIVRPIQHSVLQFPPQARNQLARRNRPRGQHLAKRTLLVQELPISQLGYDVLIGRDLLASCRFVYDGRTGQFELSY